MKHLKIWSLPLVIGAAGSVAMAAMGDFAISFWSLLALAVPFMVIGGSFAYGEGRFFHVAAIIALFSYGLWVYTFVTTPNESMGDLALIAAYTVNVGFLGAFCILTWLGYIVVRIIRGRR